MYIFLQDLPTFSPVIFSFFKKLLIPYRQKGVLSLFPHTLSSLVGDYVRFAKAWC